MSYPSALGLHGPAGAGKDTAHERLVALGGERFVRFSIADPMKDSIAALFGVSIDVLEDMKRDDHYRVVLGLPDVNDAWSDLSMREFMQRYGTEAHREIFGEDFWLKHWLRRVEAMRYGPGVDPANRPTIVNTSVRFPNEAEAILALPGGEIWQIVGPQDEGAAGHESETPLPPGLVTRYIDNTLRETWDHQVSTGIGTIETLDSGPDYSHLDDQIALVLDEWRRA